MTSLWLVLSWLSQHWGEALFWVVVGFCASNVLVVGGWVLLLRHEQRKQDAERERLNRIMQAGLPKAAGFNSRRIS